MTVRLHTLTIGSTFLLNGVNYELAESCGTFIPSTLECVNMNDLVYVELGSNSEVEPQPSDYSTECPLCDSDNMTLDQCLRGGVCCSCVKGISHAG